MRKQLVSLTILFSTHRILLWVLSFAALADLRGGHLFAQSTSGETDIVLDAESATSSTVPNGTITVSGSWTANGAAPRYGGFFLSDGNTAKSGKTVKFTPNLPVAGNYRVYAWWRGNSLYATNVPITVTGASGPVSTTVDQTANGSRWVLVGTYQFNAGTGGNVLISAAGTNGYVIVDAVRFSLVTPEVVVDSATPNPGAAELVSGVEPIGTWQTVVAADSLGGSYLSAAGAASESQSVTFLGILPTRGTYDVYVEWATPASPATSVVATVSGKADGNVFSDPNPRLNESQEGRHWRFVGRYRFDRDSPAAPVRARVKIGNGLSAGQTVTIDAVRFRKATGTEIVVDDADTNLVNGTAAVTFTPGSTSWTLAGGAEVGDFGFGFRHDNNATTGKTAIFRAALPVSDNYDVYIWYRAATTNGNTVMVSQSSAGGAFQLMQNLNQRADGDGWVYLGNYPFTAGTPSAIQISNSGAQGYVIADAVSFVRDIDSDWDGIPDAWELQYFADLGVANATRDSDGDGVPDLQEYKNNTDPTDFYNGQAPVIVKISGDNQSSPPSLILPQLVTFQINNAANQPLVGAPVNLTVTPGDGALSDTPNGAVNFNATSIPVCTDSAGQLSYYFIQASDPFVTSHIQITAGVAAPQTFSEMTTATIGWWKINEGSGTTLGDSSGAGNAGAFQTGGAGLSWSRGFDGSIGGGLLLDGAGGFVSMQDASTLDLKGGPFSVTGWIRLDQGTSLDDAASVYGIISKGTATGAGFDISVSGGSSNGLSARLSNGTSTIPLTASTDKRPVLLDGQWHHLALTRDVAGPQPVFTLYLDGASVATSTGGSIIPDDSVPLFLGRSSSGGLFKGNLDEWKIERVALTAAQVLALKNADGNSDNRPDWYDGAVPLIIKSNGDNQIGAPGLPLAQPLVAHLQDVGTGSALVGQNVTFTVSGMAKLAATQNGAQLSSLTVTTNGTGDAVVYGYYPANEGDTATIQASTTTINGVVYVTFTERASGLASWLNFEESSGNTATDATGHARSGLLNAGVTRIANCLTGTGGVNLDGIDDNITVSSSPQELILANNGAFSLSFWIKPQTFTTGTPVTLVSNANAAAGFNLAMPSSFSGAAPASLPLHFWTTSSGGTIDATTAAVIYSNRWNNIVLNWNGAQATLYVNGASVLSPTGTLLPSSQQIALGGGVTGQRSLYGAMDEVRFYRGLTLNTSQILSMYQSTLQATDSDHDGLNDFDEAARGTYADNPDSDGDGASDGDEAQAGLNPSPANAAVSDPTGTFISLKIYTPLE